MADGVLAAALRRCKPVSLRATLADGTVRELAPPGGKRKRWAATVATLERMAWVHVELLDPKGRVVELVENDQVATDLEDIADTATNGNVASLLSLMLRAQDVALKRNQEQTASLVNMNLKLCEVLMSRLNALEKGYAQNLRLAQQFVERATDEDGEGLLSDGPIAALLPLLAAKALGVPPAVVVAAQAAEASGGGDGVKE